MQTCKQTESWQSTSEQDCKEQQAGRFLTLRPTTTNKPLDAHGRGAQGTCDTCDKSTPWTCNTLSSQKSTLLKITLNDFQAFYY